MAQNPKNFIFHIWNILRPYYFTLFQCSKKLKLCSDLWKGLPTSGLPYSALTSGILGFMNWSLVLYRAPLLAVIHLGHCVLYTTVWQSLEYSAMDFYWLAYSYPYNFLHVLRNTDSYVSISLLSCSVKHGSMRVPCHCKNIKNHRFISSSL